MLLNVVIATGIVVDIEVAVVVATTSKAADVEATMVVAEAIPHSTTMAAAETTTLKAAAGTISSINNAKEGVDVAVQDQMLSARYVAEMDIPRSDVGNASTKTFKDHNGLLEWW
jgi:hypothetical protein